MLIQKPMSEPYTVEEIAAWHGEIERQYQILLAESISEDPNVVVAWQAFRNYVDYSSHLGFREEVFDIYGGVMPIHDPQYGVALMESVNRRAHRHPIKKAVKTVAGFIKDTFFPK